LAFEPFASAPREFTESVDIVPPPFIAVATWNRLLKPAPVLAVPLFATFALNVIEVPAVAVVGVGLPAVKSG
jgi:hypothetical protein